MAKKLVYDPATRRMKEVDQDGATAPSGTGRDEIGFYIFGTLLQTLVGFAREDGLDISSSKMKRGMAVNSYVRAALDTFITDRKAVMAKATAEAEAQAKADAEAPTDQANTEATEAKPLSRRQQKKQQKQQNRAA
ncbi:MAG: hypothetical protein Q8R28_15210 [Dehalococcoidia bacterium]|nr:hypothetical protein [Dehalococcoidia bacterium]